MDYRIITAFSVAILGLAMIGMGTRTPDPLTKAQCEELDVNKDGAIGLDDVGYWCIDRCGMAKEASKKVVACGQIAD